MFRRAGIATMRFATRYERSDEAVESASVMSKSFPSSRITTVMPFDQLTDISACVRLPAFLSFTSISVSSMSSETSPDLRSSIPLRVPRNLPTVADASQIASVSSTRS